MGGGWRGNGKGFCWGLGHAGLLTKKVDEMEGKTGQEGGFGWGCVDKLCG